MIDFATTVSFSVYLMLAISFTYVFFKFLSARKQSREPVITTMFVLIFGIFFDSLFWAVARLHQTGIIPLENPLNQFSRFIFTTPFLWMVPKGLMLLGAFYLIKALKGGIRESNFATIFRPVGVSRVIWHGLRQGLEKMYGPKTVSLILYRAGKEAGVEYATKYSKEMQVTGEELLRDILKKMLIMGWMDKFEIVSCKLGEAIVIKIYGSFEVRKDTRPVGDFTRGFLAGAVNILAPPSMTVEGVETHCGSKGDDYCRFQFTFFEEIKPSQPLPEEIP